jgi:hypothetical protein
LVVFNAGAVEPPQHHHRQDYVAIFAAHIEIAQGIVCDPPDEICDPVQVAVAHGRLANRFESP